MYLLYNKVSDNHAFSNGVGDGFILTKPFVTGGPVDRLFDTPETMQQQYIEVANSQNQYSYQTGRIVGELGSQLLTGAILGGSCA